MITKENQGKGILKIRRLGKMKIDCINDFQMEMVADWCAVSEERGNSPIDWANEKIGIRFKFSKEQVNLIYDLLNKIWR
jgi:hypothetical protein